MCTAATYRTRDFYFGRTLDYEFSYGETIAVVPRSYPLAFRQKETVGSHYAIIGTAHVAEGYPLFYDAVNEKGLAAAGLNFVGNAHYCDPIDGRDNIAQFEFLPWILSQCASVAEARAMLENINLTNVPFGDRFPIAQLHWIIADRDSAVTVEVVRDGLKVYDNPVGVLTNNPTFDLQMFHLNNYMGLTNGSPVNTFAPGLELEPYSRGMGGIGLPGDLSSQSRFVRVAFTKMNSVSGEGERESVSQFFHILGSVDQQRGCCLLEDGKHEITIYTSCCNCTRGIYYYTTYDNHAITGVDMHREDLDGSGLVCYPMVTEGEVRMQN